MAKKIRIEGKNIRTELERIFSVPYGIVDASINGKKCMITQFHLTEPIEKQEFQLAFDNGCVSKPVSFDLMVDLLGYGNYP